MLGRNRHDQPADFSPGEPVERVVIASVERGQVERGNHRSREVAQRAAGEFLGRRAGE